MASNRPGEMQRVNDAVVERRRCHRVSMASNRPGEMQP